MTALRTRLVLAIQGRRDSAGYCSNMDIADVVLAVLRAPSDADVERVREAIWVVIHERGGPPQDMARAAIRALLSGGGSAT